MRGELAMLLFAVVGILLVGAIIHGGRFRSSNKKK